MSALGCFFADPGNFGERGHVTSVLRDEVTVTIAGRAPKIPEWCYLGVAAIFACAAALLLMGYVANGIVVGSLIGLPGREHDMLLAHHRAIACLLGFGLLQISAAGAIFLRLELGAEASAVVRFSGRAAAAILLSFPATLFFGLLVTGIAKIPH